MRQGSAKKAGGIEPPAPLTEDEAQRLLTDLVNSLQPEGLTSFLLIAHHFAYDTDEDARNRLCIHLEKEAMPDLEGFGALVKSTLAKTLAARRREWEKGGEG